MDPDFDDSVATGTGTTVTPLEPVDVLNVYDPVEVPVPMIDSAVVVALALGGVVDIWVASDEAALDRIPENSEANELEILESVAVATMLESSELNDEAMSDSAADALPVAAGAAPVPVVLVEASETTLEISDLTDETTLLRSSLEVPVGLEVIGAVPVPEYELVAAALSLEPEPEPEPVIERVGRIPPRRPSELEVGDDVEFCGEVRSPPRRPSFDELEGFLLPVPVPCV